MRLKSTKVLDCWLRNPPGKSTVLSSSTLRRWAGPSFKRYLLFILCRLEVNLAVFIKHLPAPVIDHLFNIQFWLHPAFQLCSFLTSFNNVKTIQILFCLFLRAVLLLIRFELYTLLWLCPNWHRPPSMTQSCLQIWLAFFPGKETVGTVVFNSCTILSSIAPYLEYSWNWATSQLTLPLGTSILDLKPAF